MKPWSLSCIVPVSLSWVVACTDTSTGPRTDAGRDLGGDAFVLGPYVDPYACAMRAEALPLDEPVDASEARAGVIRDARELIGGEGASGRVGHLKIYNHRVRFVIQGRAASQGLARAIGYSLHGGNLIDADRTRARDAPGQDLFRESFPAFAFRVSSVDEVSVACDGSGGRPAAIRVVGRDVPSRILAILDGLARPQDVRIVTHYVLRPGSDVLEIITEAQSRVGSAIAPSATGDFMAFGSALTIFNESTGFGSATRATVPLTYLIGASDPGEGNRRVSYGIASATGALSVPVVDASGTVTLYNTVSAPEGMTVRFTRYFSVGDGDVTTALEPLLRARRDPVGTVRGRTTAGALVYAYRDTYTPGATVRSVARAQMDGAFRMVLPPGRYALVAVDQGRTRGTPVSVNVERDQESTASPSTGTTGTLVLDLGVFDAVTAPRARAPMKVTLRGLDVEAPDSAMGDLAGEREEYGVHRAIFSRDGQERFAVKPGRYRALVSRGDEYDTASIEVTVAAGGEATLRADLRRVIDTTGLISADFHQHTVGSVDSGRSLCGRVLENVAEGLEYAATTDHDNVTDFMPCVRELGLTERFNATRGNEISVVGVGHFNAYPLTIDTSDPGALIGAQYWADLDAQQLFDKVRREADRPILHVSHPRSSGLKGYFTYIGLDPMTLMGRRPLARGWDAIEVNDSLGTPDDYTVERDEMTRMLASRDPSRIPALRDFFGLIARGERVCALGNSDTHGRNNGSGYPHNLLAVGEDRPERVSEAMVRDAIRAQRVLVSNGVIVRIRSNGVLNMGLDRVLRAQGGSVDLELDVQAAPWVDVRSLTLFENGRPVALIDDGRNGFTLSTTAPATGWSLPLDARSPGHAGPVRFRAVVRARPSRDSFYVALARGGSLAPVGAGDAYGYTNPVYVDVDGNGWQALLR